MTKKDFGELHIPVLFNELVESIAIFNERVNVIVDCTLWMAGHASEIIKKMNSGDTFIWFDADIENLVMAEERIKWLWRDDINIILINSNYLNIKSELMARGIESVTAVYYDLWISSLHVDDATRWFSFKQEGPLDMRFDRTSWITARKVLESYNREDLARIFKEYWEESYHNKIASEIVDARRKWYKFETTTNLSDFLHSIHPNVKLKTKIFQALRIEVNSELKNLEKSIEDSIKMIEKNGRLFIISFHSLEDRIVKNIFKRESRGCLCSDVICSCKHERSLKILTKKPITPTDEEVASNSRSRSAKARLAEKI